MAVTLTPVAAAFVDVSSCLAGRLASRCSCSGFPSMEIVCVGYSGLVFVVLFILFCFAFQFKD